MPVDLTDEEVIIKFAAQEFCNAWWLPCDLDLDHLHLVEERLTGEQWERYDNELIGDTMAFPCGFFDHPDAKALIYLSAAQKIKALAAVLREEKANAE